MTISNSSRTAGPFLGTGLTSEFPFSFKVFARADVLVAVTNTATGVESIKTLDSDYTVTLNSDQNSSPGGTIFLPAPLAVGYSLAATSNLPLVQTLNLTNNGGFYPGAINDALDKIVVQIQQLSARIGLDALKVGDSAGISQAINFSSTVATAAGASLMGFVQSETGAVKRTVQQKLRDFMSANDFPGVDPTGATDSTAALGAFIAAAKTRYRGIEFSGIYKVNNLLIDAVNSLHIRGDASFIGAPTGTFACVVEIKNAQALTVSGDIVISGSGNNGCEAGLKLWSSSAGSTSLIDLSSFCVVHAKRGIQIGDPTVPGRVLSEISIHGGYTFNCPNPVIAYGTQTFVDLIGCNLQSTASASFPGAEEIGILCIGANVTQCGGELLHTTSTAGSAVEVRPILDNGVPTYGSYSGSNVTIETAAPLLKMTNPAALASPQPGIATSFVQCKGYHGHDLAPFVSTDAGFNGDLVFSANDFYTVAGRTQANINCAGFPNIWCDNKSFGKNFLAPLGGITGGGIPRFSQRLILCASNLGGQALPNATQTTLKYTSLVTTGDLARFAGNYNLTTGIFTVPTGGLKNVQIMCQQISGSVTNGSLYLQVNGALCGIANASAGGIAPVFFNVPQLAAGDQIKIVLFNIASGAQVAGSQPYDFFHILASN
jgi:hypothetical protein